MPKIPTSEKVAGMTRAEILENHDGMADAVADFVIEGAEQVDE